MNSGLSVREWDLNALLEREWLTANGIGGYASSTLPGLNTRKYHGLLVAAMAPPVRRMVLLSRVEETLWRRGQRFALDCNEYPGAIYPQGQRHLCAFFPGKSPRWIYQAEGWRIEKRLSLMDGSNTVLLTYTLLEGDEIDLQLRPLMALRPIHDLSYQFNGRIATDDRGHHHHRVAPTLRTPEVFFAHDGSFTAGPNWYLNQIYRHEQERGYSGLEDLWTPGIVRFHLAAGQRAKFACSTDPIKLDGLKDKSASVRSVGSKDATLQMLHEAAGQFVVSASPESSVACIAGFPWLGIRTRDALIGFTGLLLVPGRLKEARNLLFALASQMQKGLMPSEFPEDSSAPLYRSADIALWFANAAWDYLRYDAQAGDSTIERLLEPIQAAISHYQLGDELGLCVDADGLLATHADAQPTTWMDAKAGDWVVTPRGGKPVELNALWYNAIRIAAALCDRLDRPDRARVLNDLADSVALAFNRRFWNEAEGCCFDVLDETDASVRPNQILSASLPFAVLNGKRHAALLEKVTKVLVTPTGVRTLAAEDRNYRPHYAGNVQSRDAAHHNGPAFPWLLGPYASLLLRVHGGGVGTRAKIRELLNPCLAYMGDQGTGQLPELFDGDTPHRAGGAIASAASVGQILRCYVEDVLGKQPVSEPRAAKSPRKVGRQTKSVRVRRDASLRSGQDR